MSRQTSQPETGLLAVLHHAGGTWRLLVGTPERRRLTVVEARTFADGDAAAIAPHLVSLGVARLIGVLPASSVVCRTCTLPAADREQLEQALMLQAEAHLLGNTPPHRLAMSVLPAAPGETSRSGVLLSWPTKAPSPLPPAVLEAVKHVRFAPDLAALAELLDGLRPSEPVLWMDRSSSSVALAVTHSGGAVFRGTREEAAGSRDWAQRVGRVLAETALSVGHTGHFAESIVRDNGPAIAAVGPDDARLCLPPEVLDAARRQVEGGGADVTSDAWWQTYGIAVGVARAATGELAALTTMQDAPQIQRPSRLKSIAERLSSPETAMRVAIMCIVLLAVTPVVFSGLRLGILKLRNAHIDEQTRVVERTENQLAIYAALEGEAWSMTKILSDIVCNTPEGIELESIRVQQSDRSFAVTGTATPMREKDLSAIDLVNLMQDQLADSRVFGEIDLKWGDRNNYGHYSFDLSAKIVAPHWRPRYDVDLDFAVWTLADRQGGKGPPENGAASPSVRAASSDRDVETSDPAPLARADRTPGSEASGAVRPPDDPADPDEGEETTGTSRNRPALGGGIGGGTSSITDRGAGPAPGEAPEPLSEEQIASMTMEEVNAHLPEVAKARGRARRAGDTELMERLKREFELLLERKKEGD